MEFEQVYLATTVPASHLDAVLNAIAGAGAGIISHYSHCAFTSAGVGRFRPDAEAHPALGAREQVNTEPEIASRRSAGASRSKQSWPRCEPRIPTRSRSSTCCRCSTKRLSEG